MMRKRFLARICGAGLFALLGPIVATAQSTTPSTSGTTTTTTTPSTSGQTTNTTSSGGGGGATSAGSAEGVNAVTSLALPSNVFTATSGAGSATTIPSNANFMATTYVNPFSLGLPSLYTTQYGAQNRITETGGPKGKYTYLYVAPPTAVTTTANPSTTTKGFSTYGKLRNPVYSTSLSTDLPVVKHDITRIHLKVRDAIANSSRLKSKENIVVGIDGDTIVLTGTVLSENERVFAEGLIRTNPGVYQVRNELAIVPARN